MIALKSLWMILLLFSLLACRPEGPPDYLTTATTLGGDLKSGMPIAVATQLDSVRKCEWSVREVDRAERPEEGTRWVVTEARADPCAHLGVPGLIKLRFINDRLMEVEFEPRSAEQYLAALEEELGTSTDLREGIPIDDVRVIVREEDPLVVLWLNDPLVHFMLSGN